MSDELKRFNGNFGEEYELFKLACPHYDEFEQQVAQTLRNLLGLEGGSILEIGCGQGATTRQIVESNPGSEVTAVDNEEVMLVQARRNLILSPDVTFVHQDGLDFLLTTPDATYDAFASGFTLHNFKQDYRARFLTELYRVLKPMGFFVNGDKIAHDEETQHRRALTQNLQDVITSLVPLGKEDLAMSWVVHYVEDNKPDRIYRETPAQNQLSQLGFKDVQTIYRAGMEAIMIAKKEGG